MTTVTDWNNRGSFTEPWRPNYLYLISFDGGLSVRAGYDPDADKFHVVVTLNGSDLVNQHHGRAQDALGVAQRYVDGRLSSLWLWQLVDDRDSNARPKRVWTRGHEAPGGSRITA